MVTNFRNSLITCLFSVSALGFAFLTGVSVYKLVSPAKVNQVQQEVAAYQAPHAKSAVQFYTYLEQKPWAPVVQKYMNEQKQKEQELFDEVFAMLGINQATLNEYKKAYYSYYLEGQDRQRCDVSKRAVKKMCNVQQDDIKNFLGDCSVNIDAMNIVSTKEMGIACATQSNLYIDEAGIVNKNNELTEQVKADLLHEVQHMLHDDSFNIWILRVIFKEWAQDNQEKTKLFTALMSRFDKFRENRADILAGLVDPIYARVSADYYKNDVEVNGQDISDTHPNNSERFAYLDQLHKEMLGATKVA